jgi:hypothetical protein
MLLRVSTATSILETISYNESFATAFVTLAVIKKAHVLIIPVVRYIFVSHVSSLWWRLPAT